MVRRTLALELAHRPPTGFSRQKSISSRAAYCHNRGICGPPGRSARPVFTRRDGSRGEETRTKSSPHQAAAYRDFQDGILPAGPGARSLIAAFQHVDTELASIAAAPATVVPADRHVELLLKKRAAILHIQPANYCWFTNPAKALCLRHRRNAEAASQPVGRDRATPARCPQATFHPEHREVFGPVAPRRPRSFLGNPRIPADEKTAPGRRARPRQRRSSAAIDQAAIKEQGPGSLDHQ